MTAAGTYVTLAERPMARSPGPPTSSGLVRIAGITRMEVAYSARTGDAARHGFRVPPLAAMPVEYLTPAIEDRTGGSTFTCRQGNASCAVDSRLDHRGDGRTGKANRSARVDKDFELIAAITGQRAERLTI